MGMRGLANCKLHFLAPHLSTFGLFGNASINLVLNVAFFPSCFHIGNTILGGPPQEVNDILCDGSSQEIASSKKIITFRKVLHSKCNLTLWAPLQNSVDSSISYKTQSVDSTW